MWGQQGHDGDRQGSVTVLLSIRTKSLPSQIPGASVCANGSSTGCITPAKGTSSHGHGALSVPHGAGDFLTPDSSQ